MEMLVASLSSGEGGRNAYGASMALAGKTFLGQSLGAFLHSTKVHRLSRHRREIPAKVASFGKAGAVRPPAERWRCGEIAASGRLSPSLCRGRQHVLFSLAAFGWLPPMWVLLPRSAPPP